MWLFAFLAASIVRATDFVTCGSVIKLVNKAYTVRLHSHEVTYGSGSGQQSVTGFRHETDSNSYWWLRGPDGACGRGDTVMCGQDVMLTHINTMKNLHSHNHRSPLSNNQEISAYGSDGIGDVMDVWTVICNGNNPWRRETAVKLKHKGTQKYLAASGQQFNRPISGQMEIVGQAKAGGATEWKVAEGVFVSPATPSSRHEEL